MKAIVHALILAACAPLFSAAHAQVSEPRSVCMANCTDPAVNGPGAPAPLDPKYFWIGATASVTGDVTLILPGGKHVAPSDIARTPIAFGSRVVTGPGAKLRIIVIDGSGFTIGANSEMVLDRFVYDPATHKVTDLSVRILKGQFRYANTTGRQTEGNRRIETPVGTIGGIRGTIIDVSVDPGGSGFIHVVEGEVEFVEYDAARPVRLVAGQKLRFENFGVRGIE